MGEKIDIHDYASKFRAALKTLEGSQLSQKNKRLIREFVDSLVVEGLSNPRLVKYTLVLRHLAVILGKDYDMACREDLQKVVSQIMQKDYSVWTKQMYKVMLKRFFKWLKQTEEYPEEVKWINTTIKKSELKLPAEGDLLTEEDIKKLLDACTYPRDKAFISLLWESGCRIGEIASLKLGNVSFDKYGAQLCVFGKTGSRKIRVIASTPHLATWINYHPRKGDSSAPLWVGSNGKRQAVRYDTIRSLLQRLFEKAGINKRHNPHLFRHSRATFMASHLTEFQMNQYFGWVQGSDMPSTYVHMSGKEVDNAILAMNGIAVERKKPEEQLKPVICPRCETINATDSKICSKCSGILDVKTAMEMEEKARREQKVRSNSDAVMNKLLQDTEVQGLLARKIAEFGLAEQLLAGSNF